MVDGVANEVSAVREASAETAETVVAAMEAGTKPSPNNNASTRVLSTQTCPRVIGQGARCTSDTAARLTFVQIRPSVPGRIFISRNLKNNETGIIRQFRDYKFQDRHFLLDCKYLD